MREAAVDRSFVPRVFERVAARIGFPWLLKMLARYGIAVTAAVALFLVAAVWSAFPGLQWSIVVVAVAAAVLAATQVLRACRASGIEIELTFKSRQPEKGHDTARVLRRMSIKFHG